MSGRCPPLVGRAVEEEEGWTWKGCVDLLVFELCWEFHYFRMLRPPESQSKQFDFVIKRQSHHFPFSCPIAIRSVQTSKKNKVKKDIKFLFFFWITLVLVLVQNSSVLNNDINTRSKNVLQRKGHNTKARKKDIFDKHFFFFRKDLAWMVNGLLRLFVTCVCVG